ncbi:MAG: hypothetical protein R3C32_12000 [Chloroflexota bacterium]
MTPRRSRRARATCSGGSRPRSADIGFLDRDNVRKHPWGTSWGFSTRMVGATIMAHGDDSGAGPAAQRGLGSWSSCRFRTRRTGSAGAIRRSNASSPT